MVSAPAWLDSALRPRTQVVPQTDIGVETRSNDGSNKQDARPAKNGLGDAHQGAAEGAHNGSPERPDDVGQTGSTKAHSGSGQGWGRGRAAPAYPQLVPEALLEPPFQDELPHLRRRESAELLDFNLQHLASHEARCRLVLGRLAAVLLGQRAYRKLGFVRVGDYTRERLGLSARELQSLAQVTQWLTGRSDLVRAFKAGEVSWSELRKRVAAANDRSRGVGAETEKPRDEQSKSACAGASCTGTDAGTDGSEAAGVKAHRVAGTTEGTDDPSDDPSNVDINSDTAKGADPSAASSGNLDDLIDGEPAVEFRLPCPPSVRLLWRQAVELAARASGSSLSYWQAAEFIAAEAMGSLGGEDRPAESADWESTAGEGFAADLNVPSSSDPEDNQRRMTAAQQLAGYSDEKLGLDNQLLLPESPPRSVFPHARLPVDLARLTRDLSTISAHELDARLRYAVRAMQSLDWQSGCLLRTLFSLHLHREIGFASSSLYIRSRLQISVRKARGLVAIERATLLRCPEFSRAYRDGKISWLRALALLPALSEDSGHLWVERAARITLRRLHDEVTWALNRADATNGQSGLKPPPLGAAIDTLDSDLAAAAASADGDQTSGGSGTDTPGGTTSSTTNSEPEVHFGAYGSNGCGRYGNGGLSFSSVTIRFFGPLSVVSLLNQALERSGQPGEPRWRAMERMLRAVMQEWNSQPRHRDPVFARDGWRCSVPACSSRRNLHDHHLIFRSHGGDNRLSNRIAICAGHHLHGIHRGRLRAKRSEDGTLLWQLGPRADARPLMELRGDVYVYGAPGESTATTSSDLQALAALAIPETIG